jgi:hypothetical protein
LIAVDNDVLLKAATYGTADLLWRGVGVESRGALGAAKYVLSDVIAKRPPRKGVALVRAELDRILAAGAVLEPAEDELALAAAIESAAQAAALPLDAGESQLCAIVVRRGFDMLETGDKRAIRGFERLLSILGVLAPIKGRLRCLEQIVLHAVSEDEALSAIAEAVCAEPAADKTLSICFGCASGGVVDRGSIEQGLRSYITALREAAPRVLCPD